MNVVMTGNGHFIEIQATAEGRAFSGSELQDLLALAAAGNSPLDGRTTRPSSRKIQCARTLSFFLPHLMQGSSPSIACLRERPHLPL